MLQIASIAGLRKNFMNNAKQLRLIEYIIFVNSKRGIINTSIHILQRRNFTFIIRQSLSTPPLHHLISDHFGVSRIGCII